MTVETKECSRYPFHWQSIVLRGTCEMCGGKKDDIRIKNKNMKIKIEWERKYATLGGTDYDTETVSEEFNSIDEAVSFLTALDQI